MKNLLSWPLILSLVLVGCGDRKSSKKSDEVSRSLASVQAFDPQNLPVTTIKFLQGERQNVKADQAIKTYSSVLPHESFSRLQKLSLQVDDAGFTLSRKGNVMIMKNKEHEFKAKLVGSVDNLKLEFEGKVYDFSKPNTLPELVTLMESNVNGISKTAFALPFLKVCPLLPLALPSVSEASLSNWFFLGGMAILAIGIAYAAHTFGKSIKSTKHEIKGEVGLDQGSKDAIKDLSNRLQDINVNVDGKINTEHDLNLNLQKDAKTVE